MSSTNFCYLSNDAIMICILKLVDRKIILSRVMTLPHFPLLLCGVLGYFVILFSPIIHYRIIWLLFLSINIVNLSASYMHLM